jgi:parallel beta-helix repeat protein
MEVSMTVSILRKLLMPRTRFPRRSPSRTLEVERLEARWVAATLSVGSGKQYATLSAALMAANAGDTINVSPGTYSEQLTIAKSGIKLVAQPTTSTSNDVIITDPGVSGSVRGALIDITATNVKVTGFQINGTSSDPNLFDDILIYNGGSATISNNTILGPTNPTNTLYGIGIQVGDSQLGGTAGAGTAKINGDSISQYFGAGILVDGSGANASIGTGGANTITGSTTSTVAQYGVQVSRGASARVQDNTISNNVNSAGNSGGIFFFEVSSAVAAGNTVSDNSYGVLVQSSTGSNFGIQVVQNTVTRSGFAGIDVLSSSSVEVENNSVSGSVITAQNPGGNGIALGFSSNIEVEGNCSFSNSSDGIYVFKGSGNLILNNNSFDNTDGANGIFLEQSTCNWVLFNTTWGNDLNGIKVLGGSGNNLWLGNSHGNAQDGILLQNTTWTTIVGNEIRSNGGNGVELMNSSNTLIAFNVITHNGTQPILVDALSTNVVIFWNWIDGC